MKKFAVLVVVMMTIALVSTAMAVGPGKTVDYPGGKDGKVVFDGKKHADAKAACKDCHPDPFAMKKGAKITKAEHVSGKFCGKCHDGKKAFDQKECAKCHKK